MSTQEERIVALERITREHRPVLQNLAYELTVVKGHITTQIDISQEIKEDLHASFKQLAGYHIKTEQQIDARFNEIDARFSKVDTRLNEIDARFSKVDARFDEIDVRFNEIDKRFSEVDARFNEIDKRFSEVDAHFGEVDRRLDRLETILGRHTTLLTQILERLPKH